MVVKVRQKIWDNKTHIVSQKIFENVVSFIVSPKIGVELVIFPGFVWVENGEVVEAYEKVR